MIVSLRVDLVFDLDDQLQEAIAFKIINNLR